MTELLFEPLLPPLPQSEPQGGFLGQHWPETLSHLSAEGQLKLYSFQNPAIQLSYHSKLPVKEGQSQG